MCALYRFVGYWLMALCGFPLFAQQSQVDILSASPSELHAQTPFVEGQLLFKVDARYRSFCQEEEINIAGFSSWLKELEPISLSKNFQLTEPAATKMSGVPYDLDLIYELRFKADWKIDRVIQYVESYFAVVYAEPRYIYEPFYQPNDPLADTLGGGANQWYLAQIHANEAWDVSKGDTSVVIGITDSGISFLHPDLKKNLAINISDPIDGLDNDNDGYIDNYRGWDFAGRSGGGFGDNDPSFRSKHGVSVAGIAAATPDNGIGSAGVAFNCRYLPLKASPDNVPSAITHGYECVLYAAEQGAQVINCSWGGRVNSQFAKDIIDYVVEIKKSAVVAACGNAPADLRFYPAAFKNVLSVTNLQFQDTVCCPENLGLGTTYNYSVDVGAPGWKLSGPSNDVAYEGFSGTSAASPVASAVVAVTCAHFPDYSGFQAAQRVRVTTDDNYDIPFNRQFLHKLGTGRVNMYRALTDPRKPSIRNLTYELVNQDGESVYRPGDTVFLAGDFINYLDPSTVNFKLAMELLDSVQNSYIEWLDAETLPGSVLTDEILAVNKGMLAFRLLPQTPENVKMELRLVYTDTALWYADFEYIEFIANSTIVDIAVNDFHTSMNSTGNFGYQDYPTNEVGLGVQYRGNERNALFEGGFLLGKGSGQVSGNLRDASGVKQHDFVRIQRAIELENPFLADFEAETIFNDNGAVNPLGVTVIQRAYAWTDDNNKDFVIFDFLIQNDGPAPLTDMYAGMYANWDISDSTKNATYFNSGFKTIYALDLLVQDPAFYGISVLSDGDITAYAGGIGSSDFSDTGYFNALSNKNAGNTSAGTSGSGTNIWHMIGVGPFDILPNGNYRAGFAVLASPGINSIFITRNLAAQKYKCNVLQEGPVSGFSFAPATAGLNQPVTFSDLNSTTTTWHWDFGDGTTSNVKNPSHVYSQVGNYMVTMTASEGSCEVKKSKQVRVVYKTNSIEETFQSSFSVYPNPHDGNFFLQSNQEQSNPFDLSIYDLQGKALWTNDGLSIPTGESYLIDMSTFPAGMYFLEVISGEKKESIKVIRN